MAFFSAGFCSGKGMLTPPHVAHRHTHTYSVCEQHGQTVIVSNKWCHYLKTQQLEYYYHISGSQLGFLPIVSHSPTHWWERKDRVRVLFWIFFFFFIPVTCFHFTYAMSGCESHAAASLVFQPSTQTALWIPEHVTTEGTPSGGSPGDANVFFFCFFLVSGRHTNDRAETQ